MTEELKSKIELIIYSNKSAEEQLEDILNLLSKYYLEEKEEDEDYINNPNDSIPNTDFKLFQ